MKKLLLGAAIAVLCVLPGVSRAETPLEPGNVGAPAPADTQARPAPADGSESTEGEASEYAAREQASPQLAEFSGGGEGVYITSTAIIIVLLVVLVLVLI